MKSVNSKKFFKEINMKSIKKTIAIILSFVIIFSVFALCFSTSAKATITDIKIVQLPVKTVFYKDKDWIYGIWTTDESAPNTPILVESDKISFTHNPCSGNYPDRGMLDMTGLVIEVSYSDGTTKEIEYTETLGKTGFYKANILVSPKGGVSYFTGVNTMEVYLAENKRCYDSFDIELVEEKTACFGAKEGSTAVIDKNRFITGLKPELSAKQLLNEFLEYENVEISVSKALPSSKYIGTGSTVTVKYPDGHEELYTVIIYGDVDGNSFIDSLDVSVISYEVAVGGTLNAAQTRAANIDGMRGIASTDLTMITRASDTGLLNQVDPSSSF